MRRKSINPPKRKITLTVDVKVKADAEKKSIKSGKSISSAVNQFLPTWKP